MLQPDVRFGSLSDIYQLLRYVLSPLKADVRQRIERVCFVPKADMGLQHLLPHLIADDRLRFPKLIAFCLKKAGVRRRLPRLGYGVQSETCFSSSLSIPSRCAQGTGDRLSAFCTLNAANEWSLTTPRRLPSRF